VEGEVGTALWLKDSEAEVEAGPVDSLVRVDLLGLVELVD
jgi:hypothetical protein